MKRPFLSVRLSSVVLFLVLGLVACSKEAKRERHFSRAEVYFAAEDFEKAMLEYQNVLRLDPTNRTVLLRLARIFFEQGSPLRAMQLLQSADLKPEDPVLRCRVAEFRLAVGERETARAEVLAVLGTAPTQADALRLLAASAVTPEDLTNTLIYLRELDQKHPNTPPLLLAQSALAMRQGQLETAEQQVRRTLELDPQLALAHVQQGQLHLLRTNQAAADQSFARAIQLAPPHSPIHIAYAQARLAAGQRDEARAALEKVLKEAPDRLPASLLLARIEMQDGKSDEALALTGRVLTRDPLNLEARQLRTQVLVARKQADRAALEWEQFDQNLRPTPLIKLQVARAHLANQDATKATAALDHTLRLSSNRTDAVAIEAHLLRARLDLQSRNPLAAVELLRRLLTQTNVTEARVLLIDAQRGADRLDDAVATCESLVRDNPQNPTFAFLLGTVWRERGRLGEARQAFRRSLELSPGNLMSLYQLVDVEIAATNAPAALSLIRTELARTNSAALRFLEGRALAADQQWSEAETALRQALEIEPQFSSAYQLLAGLYLARTNLVGATRELEELAARRTNDVRSLMILGALYEQQEQFERARDQYEKILQVQPRFFPALNNLAYLYTERTPRLDRALELAQQARQLAPDDPAVADTLGWILHHRGQHQQALPLLREAADKLPDNAEVQYHLGMALYMSGQPDPARVALEKAVAGRPPFAGQSEAARQLALLQNPAAADASEDLATLEQRVREQPRDLTARARLAARLDQDGQAAQAAAQYEEILRQNPRSAPAALRLAQLQAGPLQQPAQALDSARKARELAPGDSAAAALLGRLLLQSGDHAQAYTLLRPTAQQLPADARLHADLARAAYGVGRVAEAQQAMRRALELDPALPDAAVARSFLSLTTLALEPQGLAAAEPQIRAALEADPNLAPALMAQAALLQTRGQAQAAAPLYERVLAQLPRFTPARRELGLLLAADPAQAAKAYDLLTKVREAMPDDAPVARALAVLSYRRQDHRYAVTLLEGYVRAQPNDAEALFYLGMSQRQIRQVAQGRDRLQQAIAAGLKEPLLAEAQRALADTAASP